MSENGEKSKIDGDDESQQQPRDNDRVKEDYLNQSNTTSSDKMKVRDEIAEDDGSGNNNNKMNITELKKKLNELKNMGNDEFRQRNYHDAIKYYTESLELYQNYYDRIIEDDNENDENNPNNVDDNNENDDDDKKTKTKDDDDEELKQLKVILYSNLAASNDHLESYEKAIDFCNKALELNSLHSKALLRRANLFNKLEKFDESLADYQNYLKLNPQEKSQIFPIIKELSGKIEQRNKKLLEEMTSKLKDLGNMVLKPFGLSTDNFKVEKNSETGGYSVNFQN